MKSAIVSLLFLTKQSLSSGGGWDYDDFHHWVDVSSMCDNEDESPIDIISDDAIYDETKCTSGFDWDVDYTQHLFSISNNGHSIGLRAVEETTIDPDGDLASSLFDSDDIEYTTLAESDNTMATFPNYFRPDDSDHYSFCLDSFHFHWGTTDHDGSEHFVDGEQFPLEVHFVHYSCNHADLTTTLEYLPDEETVSHKESTGEDTHQLGVVGFFFDIVEGETNPAFEAIFEVLEEITYPTADNDTIIVHDLDLLELIPQDLTSAGYYAYEGSLTTPPCTNIIRWHVMNARGWIGSEQMAKFRELMAEEGEEEHVIAPNYRELQDNVNDVYGCMEAPNTVVVDDSTTRGIVWFIAVVSMLTPVAMAVICIYQNKKEKRMLSESNKATKQ